MKTKVRPVFAVWSNTDLTEGRGVEYVAAFCELEATAKRFAKGTYIMGTDAGITKEEFRMKDGIWWAPHARVVAPTDEDKMAEKLIEMERDFAKKRETALTKAKALGLTDADIEVLRMTKA